MTDNVHVLIDKPTREALELALAFLMSDWSENMWCAGWMMGLEDDLPVWCANNPADPYAQALSAIVGLLGYWVRRNYDNSPHTVEPYYPNTKAPD